MPSSGILCSSDVLSLPAVGELCVVCPWGTQPWDCSYVLDIPHLFKHFLEKLRLLSPSWDQEASDSVLPVIQWHLQLARLLQAHFLIQMEIAEFLQQQGNILHFSCIQSRKKVCGGQFVQVFWDAVTKVLWLLFCGGSWCSSSLECQYTHGSLLPACSRRTVAGFRTSCSLV